MSIIYYIFRYPDDLRNIVQQCNVLVLILQPLCHYNSSQSSHHDRTRRGRSTQSSSGKLTLILPFDISSFSIEVSQEVTEDSDPSEEVEPQYDCGKSVGTIFNFNFYFVHWCTTVFTVENLTGETRHWGCGLRTRSSAQFCKWRQQQLLLAFLCMVSSKRQQTNHQIDQATSHDKLWLVELHKEILCAQAYQHWRRQLLFTDWDFPSCPDNSTQGECCRWSNRMIIQK